MLFKNKKLKFNAFTLAEVMVTLSIMAILASIVVPILMTSSIDPNKAMLKKAYSTTEKTIFHILSLKKTDKTFIFQLEKALMDMEPDAAVGDTNKFCFYFKDAMNTLDIQGVNCPNKDVVNKVIRFAKTPDGIDWYISPSNFLPIDYDEIQKRTMSDMQAYAKQQGDIAVNARMGEIEQRAQAAKTVAYNEAYKNSKGEIDKNTEINRSCSITSCSCPTDDEKFKLYKIYKNPAAIPPVDPEDEDSDDDSKSSKNSKSEDEPPLTFPLPGVEPYLLDENVSTDKLLLDGRTVNAAFVPAFCDNFTVDYGNIMNYENSSTSDIVCFRSENLTFVNNLYSNKGAIGVLLGDKDFFYIKSILSKSVAYSYTFSLQSVAYPQFQDSGSGQVKKSILPEIPCPCSGPAAQTGCGESSILSIIKGVVDELTSKLNNYITELINKNNIEAQQAATAYSEQIYQNTKESLTKQIREEVELKALNDVNVYNEFYQTYLSVASGSGNPTKDFSLKIIVDVNGKDKAPNCSADSSAYAYAYMPVGYQNTNCPKPDTFIFGLRYDGKIRAANSASNFDHTAVTDPVAKEYLESFIRN